MRTLSALLLATCAWPASATSFDITYNAVPMEARPAIEHAAAIWGGILQSAVPIKVLVNWFPMGGAALGITFPNGRRDFTGAPLPQTWYATALANSIVGSELNPGETDFDIWLNADVTWSYDTTGSAVPGAYDLMSIALHEMGHGLGFVGLAKKEGTTGSFGTLEASDFAPLFSSFTWPQLDTLPSIFDRYLAHAIEGPLTLMDNPGTQLGTAFTSQQIGFNGPLAMAGNGGIAPRIHATSTFALGTSMVHLNESTYPPGNPHELMTPYASPGHVTHWPGTICINMLRDIGWNVPTVGIPEPLSVHVEVYPNPAFDRVLITGTGRDPGTIRDELGRIVIRTAGDGAIDVSTWDAGFYVLTVERADGAVVRRFAKQ